jgi:hypothetical protein
VFADYFNSRLNIRMLDGKLSLIFQNVGVPGYSTLEGVVDFQYVDILNL